jgi:hypothetical protein
MQRCGVESEGRTCTLPAGRHAYHMAGGVSWENEIEASRPERRAEGKRLIDLVQGAVPPSTAEFDRSHLRPGLPAAVEASWQQTKGLWIEQAYLVLGQVAVERDSFTTAQHVWPLLPCPHRPEGGPCERRVMSVPVTRAVKSGLIVETGGVRLREIYRTLDGHEFPEGKLVPIYVRGPALSS